MENKTDQPNNKEILNPETEIINLNKLAIKYLYSGSIDNAKIYLTKARGILSSNQSNFDKMKYISLLSLTLNNMACFYKNQGKLNVALTYLSKLLIESDSYGINEGIDHASTLLNICVILSGMGK